MFIDGPVLSMLVASWYFPRKYKQWYYRAKAIDGLGVYAFVVASVAFIYHMLLFPFIYWMASSFMVPWDEIITDTDLVVIILLSIAVLATWAYTKYSAYEKMLWNFYSTEEEMARNAMEYDPTITAKDIKEHMWVYFYWLTKQIYPKKSISTEPCALLWPVPDETWMLPFSKFIEEVERTIPEFKELDEYHMKEYRRSRVFFVESSNPEIFEP